MALATYAGTASLCYQTGVEIMNETQTPTFSVNASRLRSLINNFAGKRVLELGDMVGGEYLIGKPTRIAREDPVLILEQDQERTMPGRATQGAVNARTVVA